MANWYVSMLNLLRVFELKIVRYTSPKPVVYQWYIHLGHDLYIANVLAINYKTSYKDICTFHRKLHETIFLS